MSMKQIPAVTAALRAIRKIRRMVRNVAVPAGIYRSRCGVSLRRGPGHLSASASVGDSREARIAG
jgi:hypothetical protein